MNHYSAISDKSSAQLENLGYQTLNYTVHTWNLKIKAISSCASDSDMSEIEPENGYQVLIEREHDILSQWAGKVLQYQFEDASKCKVCAPARCIMNDHIEVSK